MGNNKPEVMNSFAELAVRMKEKEVPAQEPETAPAVETGPNVLSDVRKARDEVRRYSAVLTGLPLNVADSIDLSQYGVDLFDDFVTADHMTPHNAMVAVKKMMEYQYCTDQTEGSTRIKFKNTLAGTRSHNKARHLKGMYKSA